MKHNINIACRINDKKVKIIAHMDGLLPIGNNGYRVQVWDAIISPNQELISRFTIDLNGNLYKWGDEFNEEYCTANNLSDIIFEESKKPFLFKYKIVIGEDDADAERIHEDYNNQEKIMFNGLIVGFNNKKYKIVGKEIENRTGVTIYSIEQIP